MSSSTLVPTNKAGRPILASLYDLTEYDSSEEEKKHPKVQADNLASAATFITELFGRFDIPVALMGGFAMRLVGSTRDTRDVDVVFQAPKKFARMWDIIDQERRLIIPQQRTIADVAKIFVRTGGQWDKCTHKMPVEVDLMQAGSNGSPQDVVGHRKAIDIGSNRTLYVVDHFHLLRGKLNAYDVREYERDRTDIIFLVDGYEAKIKTYKGHLDLRKVQKFVGSLTGKQKAQFAQLFEISQV